MRKIIVIVLTICLTTVAMGQIGISGGGGITKAFKSITDTTNVSRAAGKGYLYDGKLYVADGTYLMQIGSISDVSALDGQVLKKDGSVQLTGNWNAGEFVITSKDAVFDSLIVKEDLSTSTLESIGVISTAYSENYSSNIIPIGNSNFTIFTASNAIWSQTYNIDSDGNITKLDSYELIDFSAAADDDHSETQAVRLGTSNYYAVIYDSANVHTTMRTIRIDEDGTITNTTADIAIIENGYALYKRIRYVGNGYVLTIYRISSNWYAKTFKVDETNGAITSTWADSVSISSFGYSQAICKVGGNVWAVVGSDGSLHGLMETIIVNSSNGDITIADSWLFDSGNSWDYSINSKVGSEIVAVAYAEGNVQYNTIFTASIDTTNGDITKSAIATQKFYVKPGKILKRVGIAEVTTLDSVATVITRYGTSASSEGGYIYTFNLDWDDGSIVNNTAIDSLELSEYIDYPSKPVEIGDFMVYAYNANNPKIRTMRIDFAKVGIYVGAGSDSIRVSIDKPLAVGGDVVVNGDIMVSGGRFVIDGNPISGRDIALPYIDPSPYTTYTNVEDWWDVTQSAGKIIGGSFNANGDGTIDVTNGRGIMKLTDNDTSKCKFIYWLGRANLPLSEGMNYIYVYNNAGVPTVTAATSMPTDHNTNILLGMVYKQGTDLHMTEAGQVVSNYTMKDFWKDVDVNGKLQWSSGIKPSESGTRYLALTEGKIYAGLTPVTFNAFNSSTTAITAYYSNGTGGWNSTSVNQIDNQYYDDGSGSLASLSTNYKTCRYIYTDPDGHVFMIYGTSQYDKLGDAIEEEPPADLPDLVKNIGMLTAKIIIKEGMTHFKRIYSYYDMDRPAGTVVDHDELGNVLGSGEYHLSESEHTELTEWMDDVTLSDGGEVDLDNNYITSLQNATDAGAGIVGNYYSFDGVDDYGIISNCADIADDVSRTISFWFKAPSGQTNEYPRMVEKQGSYYCFAFNHGNSGSNTKFVIYDGSTSGVIDIENSKIWKNEWVKIDWVIDRENQKMYVYLNGKLEGTDSDISGVGDIENSNPLVFGAQNASARFANIKLVNFQIYNTALTADKVKALYSGAPVPFKYQGASQTPLFEDDCSADNTGDWTTEDCTMAFDTDHYTISYSTATQYVYQDNVFTPVAAGRAINISYYLRSSDGVRLNIMIGDFHNANRTSMGSHVGTGSWVKYTDTILVPDGTEDSIILYSEMSSGQSYDIKGIKLKTIGNTINLNKSKTSDTWYDESGNNLDATMHGAALVENNQFGNYKRGIKIGEGTNFSKFYVSGDSLFIITDTDTCAFKIDSKRSL